MEPNWDCIVVGGGAAGLSAALVLGRARRRTLVIDAGSPSNLPAHGIGGLLGNNTRVPADFYAAGRDEVGAHPTVVQRSGEVVAGERFTEGIRMELADGSIETARRVILAMGMDYDYPELPGVNERWGDSVFHCPFCHGWEVSGSPLGVLGRDAAAVQRAILLRSWSDDVTLLTDGAPELEAAALAQLKTAGIGIDERRATSLRGPGTSLSAVVFEDGSERVLGGLLVAVTLRQRSRLAEQLGVTFAEPNPLVAESVQLDAMFTTSVPGVLAAGDLSTRMPSVAGAIAAGSSAGAMVVHGLMAEGAVTQPVPG